MLYYDIIASSAVHWMLNAFTCMVLACKLQAKDDHVPLIEDMIRSLTSSIKYKTSVLAYD